MKRVELTLEMDLELSEEEWVALVWLTGTNPKTGGEISLHTLSGHVASVMHHEFNRVMESLYHDLEDREGWTEKARRAQRLITKQKNHENN